MWREKWVRSDHPIRVQERFTKVRRGGRCNFHAKCGWNLTGLDEVLSERKQSTNPDEYMQMNLGKMSADALVLCLGEWYQDTQYGNSLWPGIQHGTHAQGVMDAVCSPSCSVPNSSSNRAVLLGEPTSWVGTLGLASLWAFSYPRLFLNPFQSTPALLLFLSSFTDSSNTKSEMTQRHSRGSWPHRRTLSAAEEANGKTVSPSKYWTIILCPIKVLFKIEG